MIEVQGKKVCLLCGSTGRRPSGEPCDCILDRTPTVSPEDVSFIPKQYMMNYFDPSLVVEWAEGYSNGLKRLYDEILRYQALPRNILICSPPQRSKQIFAYSILQRTQRAFPILDVNEIHRYLADLDKGRIPAICKEYKLDPDAVTSTPILFVRFLSTPSPEILDSVYMLFDRRLRRGFFTAFLSVKSWDQLVKFDYNGVLKGRQGDGSLSSIRVYQWKKE